MNDTVIHLLPAQITTALLAAALIAYPLARLLLWRYVRAVEATMRALSPHRGSASPPQVLAAITAHPASTQSAAQLRAQLRNAPWRSAAIQAGIAVVIALYFGVLRLLSADIDFSPYRVIALGATHLWPGVLAVLMIAGISWRQRIVVLAAGAMLYLLLGVWVHVGPAGKALTEIGTLWLLTNLPPSLYLLAFMTRRVRAIGPLVLLVTLTTTTGVVAALATLQSSDAALKAVGGALLHLGLGAGVTLMLILLGAGIIALVVGWFLLRRLADAYAHYEVGDEGVALAAMWLSFIVLYSIDLVFGQSVYFLCGLLGFPFYLLLVRMARGLFQPRTSDEAPALLLLRVFARNGPTTALFHALSRHWRHVGPIRMIAGYDLASDTVEPDEMMAFLRRRLAGHFVTGPAIVERRLHAAPPRRDADGRYRSEEFFCFDDTWRDTLQRLVASSAVVLMDLRGFGPNNAGCVFELQALSACGALSRTVLLHDSTTKLPELQDALSEIGVELTSLHCLAVKNDEQHDLPVLLAALATRATQA